MVTRLLPSEPAMYAAFMRRDATYDGVFFTAVRTTGIFCRPSCSARKPLRKNVEFFATARDALFAGYRPCLRCRPMQNPSQTPPAVARVIDELQSDPSTRLRDRDLRRRGLDPAYLRRWFNRNYNMTFHAYQRALRLGPALGRLSRGDSVTATAFDSGYESMSGFDEAIRRLTGDSASAARNGEVVCLLRVDTPLGPMLAGTTENGVCLLEFTDRRALERQLERIARHLPGTFVPGINEVGRALIDELNEYFAGKRTEFDLPLVTPGTPFQQRVWEALQRIPYGATASYAAQARAIGQPDAVRAVARANGENRIAIIIPCHRVIGSDGKLTGYGGGLWRKQRLLELEAEVAAIEE